MSGQLLGLIGDLPPGKEAPLSCTPVVSSRPERNAPSDPPVFRFPMLLLGVSVVVELVDEILHEFRVLDGLQVETISLLAFTGMAWSAALIILRTIYVRRIVVALLLGLTLFLAHQFLNLVRSIPFLNMALFGEGRSLVEAVASRVTIVGGLGLLVGGFYLSLIEVWRLHQQSLLEQKELARQIAERKKAEEARLEVERQFHFSQKMESLGVLAGGIAHDFNNLLLGILGNADLALLDLPPDSRVRDFVEDISKAGKRAAELTRQMLAYSGRGNFLTIHTDLNELIEGMMHLLRASVSKKVEINTNLTPALPPIAADAAQVRQVVMNLIMNASDAIGDGNGVIMVSTGVMTCDREYLSETYLGRELTEGAYVYIEVSDDGIGMDQETLGRIFEPFFTTKFIGRGLGLAAVHGIMRTHRGAISVSSRPGEGTTFRILFPTGEREVVAPTVTADTTALSWQGSGKVLVVDDEEIVRIVADTMLQRMGFEVHLASNGKEGIEVFRRSAGEFSLVLLDLTMPQMSGEEALRDILAIKPDAKVLLCSGYTEEKTNQQFAGKGVAGFVRKPYTLEILRQKIRAALEG